MSNSAEYKVDDKQGWWQRLSGGLKRTSASIGSAIADLVVKRLLDQAMLDEIEDALIRADLGVSCATRIAAAVGQGRYDKAISPDEVKTVLAQEVEKVLAPVAEPLRFDTAKPFVVLVVGVNGSGKTTTIGKIAAKARTQGLSVMLVAGDTFRAAAMDQLKIWGDRSGAAVLAGAPGADAAGLVFDALIKARAERIDLLLVDTAGRLQNKAVLMDASQPLPGPGPTRSEQGFQRLGLVVDRGPRVAQLAKRSGTVAIVSSSGWRRPPRPTDGIDTCRRHGGPAPTTRRRRSCGERSG